MTNKGVTGRHFFAPGAGRKPKGGRLSTVESRKLRQQKQVLWANERPFANGALGERVALGKWRCELAITTYSYSVARASETVRKDKNESLYFCASRLREKQMLELKSCEGGETARD